MSSRLVQKNVDRSSQNNTALMNGGGIKINIRRGTAGTKIPGQVRARYANNNYTAMDRIKNVNPENERIKAMENFRASIQSTPGIS